MKYNSQESNYLNPSFPNYSKHVKGESHKSKVVVMASDLCNHQQQHNSSLMRYPSAPSSLLENLINSNGDGCDDFSMFATFMSCGGRNFVSSHLYDNGEKTSAPSQSSSPQFMVPNHRSADDVGIESSCGNIMAMDSEDVMKSTSSNCSNLISHGSSPAGLFSHMNVENGYVVMGGMGDVRGGNSINGGATASTSRFNNQMSLLPRPMSRISEMGTEIIGPSSPDNGYLGNSNGNLRAYISRELESPISSWEDSSLDNLTSLKGSGDTHGTIISSLNASEAQNGNVGNQTSLIDQFIFPKTLSEMAAMEKILQFQESLPCMIRAKRGCATHPRSIAERVRRTRISQRMRKLQELVPNMDKQTNTADMLDFAVDYIKDLQRQVKTLSDIRASCICLSKQKPYTDPVV